ncbi:hypothetical protein PMZ80_002303 [Knufia obscura]|uniref:Uncharacterized protein n=2 Tax=Knufia TaxID=430999 RepID=A0AAN8I5P9_9EURO|nr:hypothetical protein PMZ80_002303 [Knufia obscura]KAK5950661.1 hypothetical protein OHC33_008328 [Knufia fluminis]
MPLFHNVNTKTQSHSATYALALFLLPDSAARIEKIRLERVRLKKAALASASVSAPSTNVVEGAPATVIADNNAQTVTPTAKDDAAAAVPKAGNTEPEAPTVPDASKDVDVGGAMDIVDSRRDTPAATDEIVAAGDVAPNDSATKTEDDKGDAAGEGSHVAENDTAQGQPTKEELKEAEAAKPS